MESMNYNFFGAVPQCAEQPAYEEFSYGSGIQDDVGELWHDPYAPTWTGPGGTTPYGVTLVGGLPNQQDPISRSPTDSPLGESENSDLYYMEGPNTPGRDQRHSIDIPSVSDVKKRQRREQNRAAQRAFRERKVQAITDLQANVTTLENQASDLRSENQQLRHELGETRKEVEILRSVITKRCSSLVFATQPGQSPAPNPSTSPRCLVLKIDNEPGCDSMPALWRS